MKTKNFLANMFRVFVMVFVLGMSFASCTKDEDSYLGFDETTTTPVDTTSYDINGENFLHNTSALAEVNYGVFTDTMKSEVLVKHWKEGQNTYAKNPITTLEASAGNGTFAVMENYALNVTDFNFTLAPAATANIEGYYNRHIKSNGSFKVNGEQNVSFVLESRDYAKFFSEKEALALLPGSQVDSVKFKNVTIESISEPVNGERQVVYSINIDIYRTDFGASKVSISDLKTKSMSKVAKVTKSSNSGRVDVASIKVVRNVKDNGTDPGEDKYIGYGNVRQNVVYNWNKMQVEVEVLADEYYTLSGTKTVTVTKEVRPFGWNASAKDEFVSSSKNLTQGNVAQDVNSDNENTEARSQKHTIVSTYGVNAVDKNINKVFTFWWTTGWVMFHGDRIDFNIDTPVQGFGGIVQKNETSDNTYKTITTYDVKNNVTFGTQKTNSSEVVVKVKKDAPATLKSIEVEKSKVNKTNGTESTIKVIGKYSDGSTKVEETHAEFLPFGASNAGTVGKVQDGKGVSFVSSNNSVSVVNVNSYRKRHNITTTHTVKYLDGTTDVLDFPAFYESGSVKIMAGTEFERVEDFLVDELTQQYVNVVEGATAANGVYNRTNYTVNNKAVVNAKTVATTKGNVYVDVDSSPVLEKVLMSRIPKIGSTKGELVEAALLFYSNDTYKIEVNGVMQTRVWNKSELDPAIISKLVTVVWNGSEYMPAAIEVFSTGGKGYWKYYSDDKAGNNYFVDYPYFILNLNKDHWNIPVTCEVSGDKMNVRRNSDNKIIRTFNRR